MAFLTSYSISTMNLYQKRLPMRYNIDVLTYQHIDIIDIIIIIYYYYFYFLKRNRFTESLIH